MLHARGWRYRVDLAPQPDVPRRRADVVFPRRRVAVFVDGCFWHSCADHGTIPRSNTEWWTDKLAANVARDRDTERSLEAAGWNVVRVWEHESTATAVARIEATLRAGKP